MDNKPNLSKDLILNTSAKLFREKSYPQVSMRGIALELKAQRKSLKTSLKPISTLRLKTPTVLPHLTTIGFI